MQQSRKIQLFTSLAVLFVSTSTIRADTFTQTYSGSLADPTVVVQEPVSLASSSQLLVTTTSYAGGGFQPSLTLYSNTGTYLASQQAGSTVAAADAATGLALDSYLLSPSIGAGSYIVTLTNWETQQPPTATNLSDGFVNYGGSSFLDVSGAARTGSYALTVSATSGASAVPEPGSIFVTTLGLALMLLIYIARGLRTQESQGK